MFLFFLAIDFVNRKSLLPFICILVKEKKTKKNIWQHFFLSHHSEKKKETKMDLKYGALRYLNLWGGGCFVIFFKGKISQVTWFYFFLIRFCKVQLSKEKKDLWKLFGSNNKLEVNSKNKKHCNNKKKLLFVFKFLSTFFLKEKMKKIADF